MVYYHNFSFPILVQLARAAVPIITTVYSYSCLYQQFIPRHSLQGQLLPSFIQFLSYPQLLAGSSGLLALPGVGQHRCRLHDAYGVFCALTFTGPDYVSINDYSNCIFRIKAAISLCS